jgi:hypothetical protein
VTALRPEFDVTIAAGPETGRCVVLSSTYAGGHAFTQHWLTADRARALGRDLLDAAARLEAEAKQRQQQARTG